MNRQLNERDRQTVKEADRKNNRMNKQLNDRVDRWTGKDISNKQKDGQKKRQLDRVEGQTNGQATK